MRIVINPYDEKSIAQAVEMVKRYKQDFQAKEKEFTRRLAEIGVHTATTLFHMADYDGTKDVVVTLKKVDRGYAVIASGTTVGFLEFGTGVRNREWSGNGMEFTPPPHGTYGKGHGKQPYGWWFSPHEGGKAIHTYGNPPAEAMLTARDNMIMYVTQIAREVWR
jgi:hypothetical protein